MKKITKLNEVVRGMNGRAVTMDGEDMTTSKILAHFLASSHSKSAKQDIKSRRLAEKLFGYEKADILLENGELEILKEAVEQNGPGFMAFIRGKISELVESAEEVAVEEKK